MDGIAEVQAEPLVRGPDARDALPDAVGDRLPGALASAVWLAAPPADQGHELSHVEPAPRVVEEVREIPQAFRVLQVDEPAPVRDRPDVALLAEKPGGAGPRPPGTPAIASPSWRYLRCSDATGPPGAGSVEDAA